MKRVSALVLRAAGVNCNKETVEALNIAGAYRVDEIHINFLRKNKKIIRKYNILVIPGGFTYGDNVSAGKILANEIKFLLIEELKRFIKKGNILLGICNGFQVLVKSGLLSMDEKNNKQTFSLIDNDSKRFECRWVYLKVNKDKIFFKNLPDIICLPVAHNEGKFVTNEISEEFKNRIALKYSLQNGEIANGRYPFNPNGSLLDIAGITNKEGNVLGLMPHPERFIFDVQHPNYYNLKLKNRIFPYGLEIFKNIVKYI